VNGHRIALTEDSGVSLNEELSDQAEVLWIEQHSVAPKGDITPLT